MRRMPPVPLLCVLGILAGGCSSRLDHARTDLGSKEMIERLIEHYEARPTGSLRNEILRTPGHSTNTFCTVLDYLANGLGERGMFNMGTFVKSIDEGKVTFLKANRDVSLRAIHAALRESLVRCEDAARAIERGEPMPLSNTRDYYDLDVYHCLDALAVIGGKESVKVVASIGCLSLDHRTDAAVADCISKLTDGKDHNLKGWLENEGKQCFTPQEIKHLGMLRNAFVQMSSVPTRHTETNVTRTGVTQKGAARGQALDSE
jgi:hypothetical protein